MSFDIPLRKPQNIFETMTGNEKVLNELSKQRLENQYYGPNIQSEINQRNALTKGYDIANQYAPDRLRLANELSKQNLEWNPRIWQSEISNRNALTQSHNIENRFAPEKLRLANEHQRQVNELYPDLTRAQIQNYQMGGRGGLGVGSKDDALYIKSVGDDNPGFSPAEAREASNILAEGGSTMPDGRPINFTQATQRAYDRALKSTTSSPLITQGVKANQAEAELKVLNNYAQEGLKPYGNTYLNKSPQQIVDSFKSDEKSQKKLGRLIASQALGYEAAQNRIRLANGQPGVTATEELMKISGQQISTSFPMLSYVARQEAARYLDEALQKGLEARKSVGIGASSIIGKKEDKGSKLKPPSEMTTAEIEAELAGLRGK